MALEISASLPEAGAKKKVSLRRKILVEIAKMAVLLSILSPLTLHYAAPYLLFYPDTNTYNTKDAIDKLHTALQADFQDVYFPTTDGKKLHAWYFKLPGSTKTFLVSHGNAGNLEYRLLLATNLLKAGGSVFLYDYQGYGKSEGKPSIKGVCEDGIAAYDYLVNTRRLKGSDIILYGESLGCAVSTYIAEARPCAGLVLQSGFASLIGTARDKLPWFWLFPDFSLPTPRMDNVAYLAKKHPHVLLIHGMLDRTLPCRYSDEMFAKATSPKALVMLPDAGHDDVCVKNLNIYMGAIGNFLRALPPG